MGMGGGGAALPWLQLGHQNNIPTIPRLLILFVQQNGVTEPEVFRVTLLSQTESNAKETKLTVQMLKQMLVLGPDQSHSLPKLLHRRLSPVLQL